MRRTITLVLLCLVVLSSATGLAVARRGRGEPPDNHESGWLSLHGRDAVADLSSCRKCHSELSCRTCHLAPWPHPAEWQNVHGVSASRANYRGCSLCHDQSYCSPCHGGVEIPHSKDYVQAHSTGVEDDQACAICHAESDCAACHDAHASHNGGAVPR